MQGSVSTFQRKIKDFTLYCRQVNNQFQVLFINIENNESFELIINDESFPTQYSQVAENSKQLFDYVSKKTKVFKIISSGVLMCAQYMGHSQKFITLQMNKIDTQNIPSKIYQECLKIQVSKIMASFIINKERLSQLEIKCKLLQKQNKKLKKESEVLCKCMSKAANGYKRVKIDKQQEQSSQDKSPVSPQKLEENEKQSRKSILQVQLHDQTQLNQTDKKSPVYKQLAATETDQPNLYNFQIFKPTSNLKYFKINKNTIQKTIETKSTFIYSKNPIPDIKSMFSVKLTKSKYNNIVVGIFTRALFKSQQPSQSEGSVSYDNFYGIVLNNQKETKIQHQPAKQGDIIDVVIDVLNNTIEWRCRERTIALSVIPNNICLKKLYPFIQVEDNGDIIQINC